MITKRHDWDQLKIKCMFIEKSPSIHVQLRAYVLCNTQPIATEEGFSVFFILFIVFISLWIFALDDFTPSTRANNTTTSRTMKKRDVTFLSTSRHSRTCDSCNLNRVQCENASLLQLYFKNICTYEQPHFWVVKV